MKIVSLLPSATEILFALGLGDQVVGVTFECDYPPPARTKRIVSTSALPEGLDPAGIDAVVKERMAAGEDLYRLDEGAFAEIQPDLVITQDLCAVCAVDTERVDEALAYLGCSAQVVTLDPMTLDEVLATVGTVGAATGTEAVAAELVSGLRSRLDAVSTRVTEALAAGGDRPKVLVLEWADPAFTGGHWVPDMVTWAGGECVVGFPGTHSEGVSWETVTGSGADIVAVTPCGFGLEGAVDQARGVIAAGRVPAGAAVWAMNADAEVVRPGPRLVDGVETLAAICHPELFGPPKPTAALQVQDLG